MSEEVLKRLGVLEKDLAKHLSTLIRFVDLLARGHKCNCESYYRSEYEGTWHCDFHGAQKNSFSWRNN